MIGTILFAIALQQQDQNPRNTAKMFEVGEQVPNFTVEDVQGGKFDLYKSIKDKKATLLNFWIYG